MRREHYSLASRYTLIACLALALLFAQASKLHMHIDHDKTAPVTAANHIVDVHVAASSHDTEHNINHHDSFQEHHNVIDIDVSSTGSNLVKKVGSSSPFVFLLLVIFLVLSISSLHYFRLRFEQKKIQTPPYYFPLLRAPPIV